MNEKDIDYTYVWSVNRKMVVARSIKQAIDIYCVKYDMTEEDVKTVERILTYGEDLALVVTHTVEEAQP